MTRVFQFSTILALSLLSGCATIFTGSSQSIMVETQPSGADCRVSKGGRLVGEVPSTPGSVVVHRGSIGLEITCAKPGYNLAETTQPTEMEGWIFGNVFIGGLVGVAIDFTTGAAYRYDGSALLAMSAAPYGQGPALSSNGSDGSGYQQLTRVYPARTGGDDPLVVPPAAPQGDVTYHW